MALQPVPVPTNPDVPAAPGVPPLLRDITTVADKVIILGADAAQLAGLFGPPKWGIFTSGYSPVVIGDSVVAVDFRKEYRVSNYPTERGSFMDYNKTEAPFDVRISFASSGTGDLISTFESGGAVGSVISGVNPSAASRSAFLASLDAAAARLDLLLVITPEITYRDCNIVHYDYRRQARGGATLIIVDVWLQQIRTVPIGQFTQTGGASSAASSATPPDAANSASNTSTANSNSASTAPTTDNNAGTSFGHPQSSAAADPTVSGNIQPQTLTPGQDSSLGLSSPTTNPNTGGVGVDNGVLGSGGVDPAAVDVHVGTLSGAPADTPVFDGAGNFLGRPSD